VNAAPAFPSLPKSGSWTRVGSSPSDPMSQAPKDEDPFGDDLDVEILFDDEAVIAAGANSRWARRGKIALADLLDATWVGTSQQALTTALMERAFRAANLPPPKMRVITLSIQLRAYLLAGGDFLTTMPKSMLRLNPECRGPQGATDPIAEFQFSCGDRDAQEPNPDRGGGALPRPPAKPRQIRRSAPQLTLSPLPLPADYRAGRICGSGSWPARRSPWRARRAD